MCVRAQTKMGFEDFLDSLEPSTPDQGPTGGIQQVVISAETQHKMKSFQEGQGDRRQGPGFMVFEVG